MAQIKEHPCLAHKKFRIDCPQCSWELLVDSSETREVAVFLFDMGCPVSRVSSSLGISSEEAEDIRDEYRKRFDNHNVVRIKIRRVTD
jgi:hypothetical protein